MRDDKSDKREERPKERDEKGKKAVPRVEINTTTRPRRNIPASRAAKQLPPPPSALFCPCSSTAIPCATPSASPRALRRTKGVPRPASPRFGSSAS